jgi:hypothetical protein
VLCPLRVIVIAWLLLVTAWFPGSPASCGRQCWQANLTSRGKIKVIVGSPSHIGEGKAINFAKKVTKHLRVSRGWSFVNASVECEDAP